MSEFEPKIKQPAPQDELALKKEAITEKLGEDGAKEVYDAYMVVVNEANKYTEEIFEYLNILYPEIKLSPEDVRKSLMARGIDLIEEVYLVLEEKDAEKKVKEILLSTMWERPEESVVRTYFKELAQMDQEGNVSLGEYAKEQEMVMEALKRSAEMSLFTKSLASMGRLEPVPEIHWVVTRDMEDYKRRLGIDLAGLLDDLKKPGSKKNLVEFGPGSGISKRERAFSEVADDYDDFAIADRLYYDIANVVKKLIDFDKLGLDPEDQEKLADYIYKMIVIEPGQEGEDRFEYNKQNFQAITENINNLKTILIKRLADLDKVEMVPGTESKCDDQGQTYYPNKIEADKQSEAWKKVRAMLAQNPEKYLKPNFEVRDLYNDIEGFPAGTIYKDFSHMAVLEPDQVDVAIGVRSTVYVREKEFINFLENAGKILKEGGIYIDDNIRDNDGWYYRIAEIKEFVEKSKTAGMDLDIKVILGPGFPGEDHRQDMVPLAVAIGKDIDVENLLKKRLEEGYVIKDLDEIAGDEKYLQSLDKTGETARKVNELTL